MPWLDWLRRGQRAGTAHTSVIPSDASGRPRAAGVPYLLPTDMQEVNRLDFQHYLLRHAFRGNYAAPLVSPGSILDVGTGTGRWAWEMATQFPRAQVVGFDIVPPPTEAEARTTGLTSRPQNYQFVQGNVLDGLPFPNGSFDFVHMRLMVLALPAVRWPAVIGELVRVTRAGGWVESVEYAGERNGGPAITQLMNWGTQAAALRGIDTAYSTRVGALLQAAGLHNVRTQEVDLPLGAYGGRVGMMNGVDLLTAMEALASLYTTQGITTTEEFERTLQTARAEINLPHYHTISPFYIAYGQRGSN